MLRAGFPQRDGVGSVQFHTDKCHEIITNSFKSYSELFWRFSDENTVIKMRRSSMPGGGDFLLKNTGVLVVP